KGGPLAPLSPRGRGVGGEGAFLPSPRGGEGLGVRGRHGLTPSPPHPSPPRGEGGKKSAPLRGLRRLLALDEAVIAVERQAVPVLHARLARRPFHRQAADLVRLAEAEQPPRVARRQVTAAPLEEPRQLPPADL